MKKGAAAVRKWVSVKLALTERFEGLFLYLHLFLGTAVTVENPLAGPTSTHILTRTYTDPNIDFKLSLSLSFLHF